MRGLGLVPEKSPSGPAADIFSVASRDCVSTHGVFPSARAASLTPGAGGSLERS